MKTLDFMIIGAQKSGTSALATFCAEHPEICMAHPQEPHVFDAEDFSERTIDANYLPFFEHHDGERLLGELTPIYLYWPEIAERLHRYNPNLKLLILLRDPVDRAISQYAMSLHRNLEGKPLLLALLLESSRLRKHRNYQGKDSSLRNHSYMDRGNYSEQLKNLFRWYSKDQVMVLSSEQLMHQHSDTLRKVFEFLEVEEGVKIQRQLVFQSKGYKPDQLVLFILRLVFWRQRKKFQGVLKQYQA